MFSTGYKELKGAVESLMGLLALTLLALQAMHPFRDLVCFLNLGLLITNTRPFLESAACRGDVTERYCAVLGGAMVAVEMHV